MQPELREKVRTWVPVLVLVAALPLVFWALRVALPRIGPQVPPPGASAPPPGSAPAPDGGAGGTSRCGECHPAEQQAWASSTHAAAERPLGPGDPVSLRALGPDGREADFPLVRALGVTPLVQYLVAVPGTGRFQMTQQATNTATGEWFDVFPDGREPGDWGHWTGGGMTWNSRCGECHTTGFRKGSTGQGTYESRFDALGVGCAACHGTGDHPASAPAVLPDGDTCASCHARRAALDEDFRPGDRFLDHYAPALVDPSATFRPDGGVQDEDFEYNAFLGAKMHLRGVSCAQCHDPHSGRTRAPGDALCLSCHQALPTFRSDHAHHAAATAGCVDCHMPATTYMQLDVRHDHAFTIPDPALRRDFGVPSACDRCHPADGTVDPVAASAKWWGRRAPDPRSAALARARRGLPDAREALLGVLADPAPGWRAAAALHLEPWLEEDGVRAALFPLLKDPDALVRFAATDALAPVAGAADVDPALAPLLRDPVKAVRVGAARALRFRLSPADATVRDYVAYLSLHADDPSALLERATWAMERGDAAAARRDLEAARALDPRSVAVLDTLAVLSAGTGRPEAAVPLLEAACALAPDDAELRFRLALAHAGVGDEAAARRALAEVVRMAPEFDRAWYNLGLLEARDGGTGGLASLRKAVELRPDAETRYALAVTLARTDPAEAAREARRALEVDPGHPGARALLQQLVP